MFNENNIVETIKKRKLRWVGHAMQSKNSLLRMLEQNPVGKRPLGRPRLRWEDPSCRINPKNKIHFEYCQKIQKYAAI